MAETLTARGGGMSKVSALVRRGAQVEVQRRETKSMVSVAQSMAVLWCQSQGIPRMRGFVTSLVTKAEILSRWPLMSRPILTT